MAKAQQTINPANGETIATYELNSDAQTLKDSHQAFLKWRTTSLEERGSILRDIAKRLRAKKDDTPSLIVTVHSHWQMHSPALLETPHRTPN